jgi:hypothetical protein
VTMAKLASSSKAPEAESRSGDVFRSVCELTRGCLGGVGKQDAASLETASRAVEALRWGAVGCCGSLWVL